MSQTIKQTDEKVKRRVDALFSSIFGELLFGKEARNRMIDLATLHFESAIMEAIEDKLKRHQNEEIEELEKKLSRYGDALIYIITLTSCPLPSSVKVLEAARDALIVPESEPEEAQEPQVEESIHIPNVASTLMRYKEALVIIHSTMPAASALPQARRCDCCTKLVRIAYKALYDYAVEPEEAAGTGGA